MENNVSKEEKISRLFLLSIKKLNKSFLSESKMKDFLIKKGANKEEVVEVLEKLKCYSLINEDELIENILSLADQKHYGYNRIILMLKERQINEHKINKIIKDENRELTQAKEMTKTLVKRYKNKNTVNLKRNVYWSLIRYGFDEIIASNISSSVYNSPQQELNVLKLDYDKLFSSSSRKVKGKELDNKIKKALINKGYKLDDINKVVFKERDEYEIN